MGAQLSTSQQWETKGGKKMAEAPATPSRAYPPSYGQPEDLSECPISLKGSAPFE